MQRVIAVSTAAQKLSEQAREAAQLRAWQTDPAVVALKVERLRTTVDRLIWSAIVIGLAFTAANVQQFAAGGASAWTLQWCAAWLLDPMVSLVVLGILLAESVTSRWQVHTGGWVRTAKWFALLATYVMNTWQSWADMMRGHFTTGWDQVVLHSVPPLLVLVAAEAAPILRDRLTEAVLVAERNAAQAAAKSIARGAAAYDRQRGLSTNAQPGVLLAAQLATARLDEPVTAPADAGERPSVSFSPEPTSFTTAEDQSAEHRPALHLVSRVAASQQETADETADEMTDPATPEARMRAHWDREVTAGRVPSGAELARAGGVSPATGKRRRAAWEAELPDHMRGGDLDVVPA
jgi:hypothetical protein